MADPKKNNHITGSTETLVARIPTVIKRAVEREAEEAGTSPAAVVREALARDLKRRGWKLTPETLAASGI